MCYVLRITKVLPGCTVYIHCSPPPPDSCRTKCTVVPLPNPYPSINPPPEVLKNLWSSNSTPATIHDCTDVGIPSFWWSFCLHSKIVSPFVASNSTVRPCVKTTKKGMVQAVFPSSSVRSNDVRCSPLLLDDDTPVAFAPALSPRSKEGRSNMDMTSTSSAVPVCVFCGEYTL